MSHTQRQYSWLPNQSSCFHLPIQEVRWKRLLYASPPHLSGAYTVSVHPIKSCMYSTRFLKLQYLLVWVCSYRCWSDAFILSSRLSSQTVERFSLKCRLKELKESFTWNQTGHLALTFPWNVPYITSFTWNQRYIFLNQTGCIVNSLWHIYFRNLIATLQLPDGNIAQWMEDMVKFGYLLAQLSLHMT